MTTWDYASLGGTKWPIHPGDLWAVGDALILCGDPEVGSAELCLELVGHVPQLAFVDPPWGPGIHAGFRVKSNLGPYQSYDVLMSNVLGVCAKAPITLIETGRKIVDDTERRASEVGLQPTARWEITYGSKTPCVLTALVPAGSWKAPPALPDFGGLSDKDAARLAMLSLTAPGDFVLDPFCGVGRSALAAAEHECNFVGSELQPERASVCLEVLHKKGYGTPTKIDHFPDVADSETYACRA